RGVSWSGTVNLPFSSDPVLLLVPLSPVLLALLALGTAVLAGGPVDWAFTMDTSREIQLPVAIVQAVEFGELEYDGPPYRGFLADLNGDGVPEYVVQSAPTLCANGGCPYALFDGATLRPLGLSSAR